MADTTRNLGLPLIAGAQAQKHVTHNEAITALDALVQLACLDKDLTGPPASPSEGDRYLVTVADPTGAWAGLSGQVVRFQDGVWIGAVPQAGWFAYLLDEGDLYIFTGGAWTSFRASLTALQTLPRLGIGTTADAVNRFALKSDAALLSFDDVAPGSGDIRVTLNKRAAARDAGFVIQDGYSSRALLGALGDDDFTVKVSPDGASFVEGLRIRAGSGLASFPSLLAPPARPPTFTGPAGGVSIDAAASRLVLHDGATPGGIPAARLDEVAPLRFTGVADANYTILPGDGTVALTAALSAPRTLTLPAAASVKPGKGLRIVDQAGGVSATNRLTLATAGGDRLNGAASAILTAPYTDAALVSDGVAAWTYDVQGLTRGGTGATTAAAARANLGSAASGANTDITALAGLTVPLSLGQGGTGAATAAGAVAALGLTTRTAVADANYTALASDRTVALTALTAARTVTLPSASAYPTGTQLLVVDESGACSGTNTITLARAGSDTINGAASLTIATAFGALGLMSNGAGRWTLVDQTVTALQLVRLGIGTAADATNRLAVKSEAALLSWDDVTPGAGNMRATVNKKAAANDAGLTFQTGFSARALLGTLGADDFTLKVSADGTTFSTPLTASAATGRLTLGRVNGVLDVSSNAGSLPAPPLDTALRVSGADGAGARMALDAFNGAGGLVFRTSSGTAAAPAGLTSGSTIGAVSAFGYGATAYGTGARAQIAFVSTEAWTDAAQGARISVRSTPTGTTGTAEVFAAEANGSVKLTPLSADPTAGLGQGQIYANSTVTALKWHNGTAWSRINNFAKAAAYTSFDNYIAAATWTKVQFNNADSNDQGAFSASNNRFVAPEAGLYALSAALVFKRNGSNSPTAFEVQFYRNGTAAGRGRASATGTLVDGVSALDLTSMLKLAANDYVEVYARFTTADGYVAAVDSFFGAQQLA